MLALVLVTTSLAVAQIHPHFGVEVGTPLTDTLTSTSFMSVAGANTNSTRSNSETKRLVIGPAFRLDLASGLGLEIDALYQRVDFDRLDIYSPPLSRNFEALAANRWQFPLLIQYRNKFAKLGWYVEGGPSIEHFTAWHGTTSSFTAASGTSAATSSSSTTNGTGNTYSGITLGAGVDVPVSRIHLRPEFRFSHWFLSANGTLANVLALYPVSLSSVVSGSFFAGPSTSSPNQNEASFLLGIAF